MTQYVIISTFCTIMTIILSHIFDVNLVNITYFDLILTFF